MENKQKEKENKTIFTTKEGVPLTEESLRHNRFVAFTENDGKKNFGNIISIDPETKTAMVDVKLPGKVFRKVMRGYAKEKRPINTDKIVGVGKTSDEALNWKNKEGSVKVAQANAEEQEKK